MELGTAILILGVLYLAVVSKGFRIALGVAVVGGYGLLALDAYYIHPAMDLDKVLSHKDRSECHLWEDGITPGCEGVAFVPGQNAHPDGYDWRK